MFNGATCLVVFKETLSSSRWSRPSELPYAKNDAIDANPMTDGRNLAQLDFWGQLDFAK
jgi:hypothetical protein